MLRDLRTSYLLLALTSLLWAINWVVARAIRLDSGPNAMALGRWLTALVLILPFAWPHLARDWPALRARIGTLVLLSATGTGAYNAISYAGVAHTTAVNAMLLNATVPFYIMGLSWLVLREEMRAGQFAGLLVSFAGAAWIIVAGEPSRLATLTFNHGDLLVCLAMLSWAVYTIILKKRPVPVHITSYVAILAILASVTLLPLTLWEIQSQPVRFSPQVLAAYLYMGIGPSVLCYLFWNHGVATLGANRTGMFLYLVPVFGSVVSALALGERPELFHAVGFAMVLAGLGLSNWRRA